MAGQCQIGARAQGFATPRKTGAPLTRSAPFWQDGFATGGSGGMSLGVVVFDRENLEAKN
jgi:hypothetical protein